MSHGGGGGFGHSGGHHGGHGGHHSGGHPDQSPNWNSALQGERPGGKFITSLPNPTIVPIFLAIGVFLLMLAPFVIEWDYDSLPWVKHSTEEAAAPSQPDASVQADRDLLDATKNSMLQAQANIRAEAARQRSLAAAQEAGTDAEAQQAATQSSAQNAYQDQTQTQLAAQPQMQAQADQATQVQPQPYYQPNLMQAAPLTADPSQVQGQPYSGYSQNYAAPDQSYQTYVPSGQAYTSTGQSYTPSTPANPPTRFRVFAGR